MVYLLAPDHHTNRNTPTTTITIPSAIKQGQPHASGPIMDSRTAAAEFQSGTTAEEQNQTPGTTTPMRNGGDGSTRSKSGQATHLHASSQSKSLLTSSPGPPHPVSSGTQGGNQKRHHRRASSDGDTAVVIESNSIA